MHICKKNSVKFSFQPKTCKSVKIVVPLYAENNTSYEYTFYCDR